MPYSGPDDETLPEAVQGLDDETRAAWVARWNETYSACIDDEGEEADCETRAFAVANALIEDDDAEAAEGFCFVEMGEGRPVEILRVGEFTDRNGRAVEITAEDLDAYVANFQAGAAGQDVPFDIQHERAEAAGWLKALWREGERLLGMPDWSALGEELVKGRVYRYLSATIDMVAKVIKSVSLVNFPAVKGLAPIELAEGIYTWGTGQVTLSGYLQANLHQHFTGVADQMAMAGMVDVEQRVVLGGAIGTALEAFAGAMGDLGETLIAAPEFGPYYYSEHQEGASEMTGVQKPTETALRAQLRKEMETEMAAEKTRLAELRTDVRKEVEVELEARFARRKELVEFADGLCSGDRALSTPPDQVVAFLEALPEDQVEAAKAMLQAKVVPLAELGSSGDGRDNGGKKKLPDEYAAMLRAGELEVVDLANPVLQLGDLSEYNLAEFQG